ncbi:hypothetical protein WA158_003765 [Blastocystis sp. Blastoise]
METLYHVTKDFDWSNESLPNKSKILLSDTSLMNSLFLVTHFLNMSLKGDASVFFGALSQTYEFYSSLSKKGGINLEKCLQSGNLTVYTRLSSSTSTEIQSLSSYSEFFPRLLEDLQVADKTIYTCVLIDDIYLCGKSIEYIMDNLRDIQDILSTFNNYSLIYRCHQDISTDNEISYLSSLRHFSDYEISLLPLQTGHSITSNAQVFI